MPDHDDRDWEGVKKAAKKGSTASGRKRTGDPITDVAAAITAKYGQGSVARMSDEGAVPDVKHVVPTGLPSLDAAFGVGGLPLGKMIEISGPESSGKSTIAKAMAIQCQKAGVVPLLCDGESSSDTAWDRGMG